MLKKILIANRGEIAIRIMRTCREMGVDAVAVYSTADRDALHVQLASEAICIGGPRPADSYLKYKNILTAALQTGCDAIHPGYGFLSEQADFAELCQQAGLVFIGPEPETIRLLGDKSKARELAQKAGIPVVPGSIGALENVRQAITIAAEIGYPVLLKASAGGGGRGMRFVNSEDELANAYGEARQEALVAFGQDELYLEKLIRQPKHVEVQILADHAGRVVHLGERECSLQRKRQKLIEESPANIPDDLRKQLTTAAVKLGEASGYLGAGTVEFIVDSDNNFYFIEVNTRIQVEHPVSEWRSGIDLIREQIRIAGGAELNFAQEAIHLTGHAIECRLNAENPRESFRPAPGKIEQFVLPGGLGVRLDTAIYPGYEVSPWYDSMLGKLIVYGKNRSEAIRRLRRCLEETIIEGVESNLGLLYVLLFEPEFIRGDYHTEFVEANLERLLNFPDLMER
ncbi:MAG: acetyl-CoA carboxylase biotin carboxylase subunit [Eubacteriales bacterium]|nr:acetyl-CoA carboxylase biotin carboxylase subunit [Eubacteriales bacterium]